MYWKEDGSKKTSLSIVKTVLKHTQKNNKRILHNNEYLDLMFCALDRYISNEYIYGFIIIIKYPMWTYW